MVFENRKIALVTGASRGIGKAICEKLVSEGYFVYGTYNTGEKEAIELKQRLGNVEMLKVDFKNREDTLKLIEQLKGVKFDAIVNNAGMFEREDFEDYKMENWDNTIEVNLTAPLVIAIKLKNNVKKGGAIVNIASRDGFIGSFASMAYSASKAALINITKSLGNNFGKIGVRVNAIAPGWINTGMATESSYEAPDLTPLGRNGEPEEVADLASFLISGKASFINGTTIMIDGGYSNVDYIIKKEAESA